VGGLAVSTIAVITLTRVFLRRVAR
jgi:hypothetical protein